jgi:hypothetical protein
MSSIKRLGFACVVAAAIAACVGVASASASEFHAEKFPVTLKGSGNQKFGTNAGSTICTTSAQKGEATSSATWWSVKVGDSGCTLSGLLATVEWGECEIRYYTYSGLYIVCKGGVVKITSGSCVIEIGPQEVESVSFTGAGSGTTRTIIALVNVSGLKYTQSSKCAGGAGTFTNGTMGGEIKLEGSTSEGIQQGIWIE